MPHSSIIDDHADGARSALRQALMAAFCSVLQTTRLPPMTVLELAAEAAGSIYQEVADAHRHDDACPCGWRPCLGADIQTLQAALALTAHPATGLDLRTVTAVGQA